MGLETGIRPEPHDGRHDQEPKDKTFGKITAKPAYVRDKLCFLDYKGYVIAS